MPLHCLRYFAPVLLFLPAGLGFAQSAAPEACPRGAAGSAVPETTDLRSANGELRLDLHYRTSIDGAGRVRYCYIDQNGNESPTLRVKPGDELVLTLKNDLPTEATPEAVPSAHVHQTNLHNSADICAAGPMSASSTNLHFHGFVIPPDCHQDDTLHTVIAPSAAPFEYKFRVPARQAPGLYWYHPHIHGSNRLQILGGASGALIVEGIETVDRAVSGLPERVIIIRDQDLVNPDAAPVQTDSMPAPQVLRDAEGDILNTGSGTGKPAKDLSINFVPVAFPEYRPASIFMKPGEPQLWRVLNASAITYLDLQLLVQEKAQQLGVVALDGIPVNANGNREQPVVWKGHVAIPPAGRAEFIVKAPPQGLPASLITRSVDSGPAGENDPTRPLAKIQVEPDAPALQARLPASPTVLLPPGPLALKDVKPARQRKLYFFEQPQDPKDPKSPTGFYLTVDGQKPAPFDPHSTLPNIVAHQGDVEDWIIENRTRELHDFHIHQTHFQLLEWNGAPVDEPYLRDTVNVSYWDGHSPVYPSVKLRIDFRDPAIVGTFLYHCHLLEHADGGMMGIIQVLPARAALAVGNPRR